MFSFTTIVVALVLYNSLVATCVSGYRMWLISFTALENHTKQYIKFDKVDIYHIQLYIYRERDIFVYFKAIIQLSDMYYQVGKKISDHCVKTDFLTNMIQV